MTTTTLIDPETLTRDERSVLLYAETCCVDYGGLLESRRMNSNDLVALREFADAGILTFGRIPSDLLAPLADYGRAPTHWITFTDAAWTLAHALRRARAAKPSKSRSRVDAALAERTAA